MAAKQGEGPPLMLVVEEVLRELALPVEGVVACSGEAA